MAEGVRIEGLEPLIAGLKRLEPLVAAGLKVELKKAGDLVRADAQQRFEGTSPESAMGYRVYLRQAGSRVDVEQSLSRVTGLRPDWGALQMRRALIPALEEKQDQLFSAAERMIQEVGDRVA